jgi:hypothetical protein
MTPIQSHRRGHRNFSLSAPAPTIKGYGFKTLVRTLTAGEHRVMLSFTKTGTTSRKHHTLTFLSVTVNVAGRPVTARQRIRL